MSDFPDNRITMTTRVPLGRVVITHPCSAWLEEHGRHLAQAGIALYRHSVGDWGDLDDEDKASNDAAVKDGGRLLSAYMVDDRTIWIITEADRSVTTMLFPEDY